MLFRSADTISNRRKPWWAESARGKRGFEVVKRSKGHLADAASIGQQGSWPSWFGCDPAEAGEGQATRLVSERVHGIGRAEPVMGRVAYGLADRSHQLAALGNGQVPCVAAAAFLYLARRGGWL